MPKVKKNKTEVNDAPDLERIKNKIVDTWTVAEVGLWLDFIGVGDLYKKTFIENEISGMELIDLSESELTALGVTKLGPRKRLVQKIGILKGGGSDDWNDSQSNHSSEPDSFDNRSTSSSGATTASSASSKKKGSTKLIIKFNFKGDTRVVSVPKDATLDRVKRKAKSEYKKKMRLYYIDDDGDKMEIRRTSNWETAVDQFNDSDARKMVIECKPKRENIRIDDEKYNEQLDAKISIQTDGTIIEFNDTAVKLWGFSKSSIVGKNVSKLMPSDMAVQHNGIIKKYLETGKSSILGRGRAVIAQKKDGSTFSIFLTLIEAMKNGEKIFTGTCSPLSNTNTKQSMIGTLDVSQYAMFDHILDCCIVIDQVGTVQYANRALTTLLEWEPQDIISKNIAQIMPPPFTDEHDQYLKNYMTTGVKKIIGTGRNVVAKKKSGSILKIHLALTERRISDTSVMFTGIIRSAEKEEQRDNIIDTERKVIEKLVVPAIIIDQSGIIQAANNALCQLFSFKIEQLLGQNVSMLMPPPESNRHDQYLANYTTTKRAKSKVVGQGREVIAKHRTGRLIPLYLSVTETKGPNNVYFTGILQKK